MAQAFRNNPQLQQFFLTDVTPTGRVLGTGSYGSVEEVCFLASFPVPILRGGGIGTGDAASMFP